jgi:hypothetical protein
VTLPVKLLAVSLLTLKVEVAFPPAPPAPEGAPPLVAPPAPPKASCVIVKCPSAPVELAGALAMLAEPPAPPLAPLLPAPPFPPVADDET